MNKKLKLAVVAMAVAGLMALIVLDCSLSRERLAVSHSGRLASYGSNDDRPECFHEQKPPTEPVHLHAKTFQPHPYKRDDGAPGLAPGHDDGNCGSVGGGVWKCLISPSRHIRSGRWETHDPRGSCKG